MKSVLISIRPRHNCDIANLRKSLELRKNRPNLELPFKCYIYCTAGKPYMVYDDAPYWSGYTTLYGYSEERAKKIWEVMNGKVIGEFTCDYILHLEAHCDRHEELPGSPGEWYLEWEEDPPACYRSNEDVWRAVCLKKEEVMSYIVNDGYFWHISDLKIYEDPKPLGNFVPWCNCMTCDGECDHRKVSCSFQQADYNPDGSLNAVMCGKRISRPPQSWCYVEEV